MLIAVWCGSRTVHARGCVRGAVSTASLSVQWLVMGAELHTAHICGALQSPASCGSPSAGTNVAATSVVCYTL
jgi:hypothetical protein